MLAKLGRRCKTVYTKQDILSRSGSAIQIQRFLLGRLFLDRIVAIFDVVVDHLIRDRGLSSRHVVKIPAPVIIGPLTWIKM